MGEKHFAPDENGFEIRIIERVQDTMESSE